MEKPTNRFIKTIREKVKYPNLGGQYGQWDILNPDQRRFLIECADYMESMECVLQEMILEQPKDLSAVIHLLKVIARMAGDTAKSLE